MGHGNSRSDSSSGDGSKPLRMRRLRLHSRHSRHTSGSQSHISKILKEEDFAGIALIRIIKLTSRPGTQKGSFFWKDMEHILQEYLFLRKIRIYAFCHTESFMNYVAPGIYIQFSGARLSLTFILEEDIVVSFSSLHDVALGNANIGLSSELSRNNLIGYCEVDLLEFLSKDSSSDTEVFDLLDPSSASTVVGRISISCCIEDPVEMEKTFVRRILSIVDCNEDGELSLTEFSDLIDAFGNKLAAEKKEEIFEQADRNGDGVVSLDELATLLAIQNEKEPIINCCPVCGEVLEVSDGLNNMIHMTLCFDEGTGNQVMTGGFLTDKEASSGWMFKLSEWAHFSTFDIGLRSGSSASHILVYDRRKERLVEEIIDRKIVLSMRAIYQSKFGLGLMDNGAKEILRSLSEKQGKKMDSAESAKEIPNFIEFFKDQINMDEVKYPLEQFKTFNEFFIRELKPGARPIALEECDDIAVCAADCRLMAFNSVTDSIRCWIKGRKFSIQGLLGNETCSAEFVNGALVIFRLAPQDYHRFHFPVSGTIEKFIEKPGCLYTVNPIAVNSKYCNVFTENKRVVSIISTEHFGKVAFVAIGATMVGSINFSRKEGDYVKKGDEFGYFSFGGSTVICVFEKDSIKIDEDFLENSARSLETLVSVGMQLGVSVKKQGNMELPNFRNLSL
ncbi:hypothetical protein RND71_041452 [Anisodus tanguticus]|uniref:Phosphatidylserine decarboxylase proenzyme 2 n=1 Tax=Anisodus tanguticus TaxID=243964 RepID=A0AAE1QUR8_9SOLA|nr:hypothetical protein RND71_041452 [Anisodus tanguticus]